MKNILYLITDLEIGGTEKALCRIVRGLDKTQFNPTVAALVGEGPIGKDIKALGVKVFYLHMNIFKLVKILRAHKTQILHSFLFHANMMGKVAGLVANTPVVLSTYRCLDGVGEGKFFYLSCERILGALSDKVICVSDAVKRHVHKYAGTPLDKLVTIYNGVEILHDSYEERQTVVALSRLEHSKAIDELLLAAQIVIKKLPETKFIVVGDGDAKEELIKMAETLGIAKNVIFAGWRYDIARVLNSADVFAHPTRMGEGMPSAILEAMSAGKPTVATDLGGTREIVAEGKTGFLVSPADFNTFANKIILLLKDRSLRNQMGENSLKAIKEKFSIEIMVKTYQSLYSNLLK